MVHDRKHEEDSYQWIKVKFNKNGKLQFVLNNAWRSVEDMGIDDLIENCYSHLEAQEKYFKKMNKKYDFICSNCASKISSNL